MIKHTSSIDNNSSSNNNNSNSNKDEVDVCIIL